MQPRHRAWTAEVLRCSSLNGNGIAEIAEKTEAFRKALSRSGALAAQPRAQAGLWFYQRELRPRDPGAPGGRPDLARLLAEQEARSPKAKPAQPAPHGKLWIGCWLARIQGTNKTIVSEVVVFTINLSSFLSTF